MQVNGSVLRMTFTPLLFALAGNVNATSEPAAWHRYSVTVDPALATLTVRACFADGLPDQLRADHVIAGRATTEMRLLLDGEKIRFEPRGNVANFRRPSDDGCLAWDTDLREIAAIERMTSGYRAGNSLLLEPAMWLWRPWHMSSNRDIEFTFDLPPGFSVSVPWQPLHARRPATRFRFGQGRFDWPALMAIGELHHESISVPGGELRMAMTDGPAVPAPDLAARWLRPAALAVTRMTGRFPRRSPQVLVIPLDAGRDAAPWAQVNRGGGVAAHFFMNTRADWSVFADDWIAAHELSHMAMPFVSRSDAWLPEGLASYYQNVLRARLGLLGERQAWQKLHDGFRRGQGNTGNGSLRDVSRSRQRIANNMRIYWSGAAIALMADVELRRRTDGHWTLDKVIASLQACCLEGNVTWSAKEIFAHFDAVSGTTVFADLYANTVYSRHFPPISDTFAALGIEVADNGRVHLDDDAPAAEIRKAIMAVQSPAMKRAAINAALTGSTRDEFSDSARSGAGK